MKKSLVMLIVLCNVFAAIDVSGQVSGNQKPEVPRKHVVEFLGHLGLEMGKDDTLVMPKEIPPGHAKQKHRLYRLDLSNDSRFTLDETGKVCEFFGSLERPSKSAKNPGVLSERLLRTVLSKGMVVARPTISEDGARSVHYTFRRTIKGIPVEGQRVRMAFDTQTGDLLYFKNTIEDFGELTIELLPTIGHQQATEQAKTTVLQDLHTARWEGMLDPEAVVLVAFDRPGNADKSRRDLIITSHNVRFLPSSSEAPISADDEKWTLAYDIPIEIQAKLGSQQHVKAKLFARVWVDAHTGKVIGGE